MGKKEYPKKHLEQIRAEAMKTPADTNLVFRLQKRLQAKKVEHRSNPFKDVTAEEGSKLLNTEIE